MPKVPDGNTGMAREGTGEGMTVRERVTRWQAEHSNFRQDLENAYTPFYLVDTQEPCPSLNIAGRAVNDLYELCEALDRWVEVKNSGINLTEWEMGRLQEAENDIREAFERLNAVGVMS